MDEEFKQKYGPASLQKLSDKNNNKLQYGIDISKLGVSFQDPVEIRFISPFINNNSTCPDPLTKAPQILNEKVQQKITRKPEIFSILSEETLIYIFYNVMDEEQQMIAVEQLYNKGWRYNLKKEQWFRDLQQIQKNLYSAKYFSIQNWKQVESSQIEMSEDEFCTIEQFNLIIKCLKHPQTSISNICLNEECKEDHEFCQNCVKLHLNHTHQVIYVKQIEKLLRRNSNVNQIVYDKQGVETYEIFRKFKKNIETRLQQLEEELRKLILDMVNDGNLNQFGQQFLQSFNDFNKQDLENLRQYLIKELQNITTNQVELKQKEGRVKLQKLQEELNEKIPGLQQSIIENLECVNTVFYTQCEKIERLRKVWICDDGQSKPSVFDKNTIRANVFQIRDKPLYLIGIYQPMLYKGSYNSTNYDSQSKTPKLVYKIHQGTDLTNYIFKQQKIIEHEKMKLEDGHLYYIEFKNPLKLLPNETYTLSISTKDPKSFQMYHYSMPVIDHPLIKWQTEDLSDSDKFIKSPYIQRIYSYANIDQIPSIKVKLQ